MSLTVYKSADGRYRSDFYTAEGERAFAIAEKTLKGVLVSEFNEKGELLDQIYKKSNEPLKEIAEHLKGLTGKVLIENVEFHTPVGVDAACSDCGREIRREFDLIDTKLVGNVPVIPIFVCANCKKKFYSMNPKYIRKLVSRNPELFEQEELRQKQADEAAFISEIQEYMIRIFASKRLTLMKINK